MTGRQDKIMALVLIGLGFVLAAAAACGRLADLI